MKVWTMVNTFFSGDGEYDCIMEVYDTYDKAVTALRVAVADIEAHYDMPQNTLALDGQTHYLNMEFAEMPDNKSNWDWSWFGDDTYAEFYNMWTNRRTEIEVREMEVQ